MMLMMAKRGDLMMGLGRSPYVSLCSFTAARHSPAEASTAGLSGHVAGAVATALERPQQRQN